jgi:hypothetical protein
VERLGLELFAGVKLAVANGRIALQRAPGRVRSVVFRAGALAVALLLVTGGSVRAQEIVAVYDAYWAGLPAGTIRLELQDGGGAYRDRIEIRSTGLPRLVTHFTTTAQADGWLVAGRQADPSRYEARYDLHKRRDSRISIRFVNRGDATIAERGPSDTSHEPPLAPRFRRDAVDPMTAVERLREAIAAGAANRDFSIPVYDGTRRFDVVARVLPKEDQSSGLLKVDLTLRPIAGFKGDAPDNGDTDDAPRQVALTLSDNAQLLPVSLTVQVFYLPLVVRLDHLCSGSAPCRG